MPSGLVATCNTHPLFDKEPELAVFCYTTSSARQKPEACMPAYITRLRLFVQQPNHPRPIPTHIHLPTASQRSKHLDGGCGKLLSCPVAILDYLLTYVGTADTNFISVTVRHFFHRSAQDRWTAYLLSNIHGA